MELNYISIFGYGSLMDIDSAHLTMPSAKNFRKGILHNYVRSYNLVSISGIKKGIANIETKELNALSVKKQEGVDVMGILFDIPEDELPAYLIREHRYVFKEENVEEVDKNTVVTAWTVVESNDADYKLKCGAADYNERVHQYYDGSLWHRIDTFPMTEYMINVLLASFKLGKKLWLQNYLHHTLLSDGCTTLVQYIKGCFNVVHLQQHNNLNDYSRSEHVVNRLRSVDPEIMELIS